MKRFYCQVSAGRHYAMSCLDWAVFYGEDLPKHGGLSQVVRCPAYKKAMAINYANLPEVLMGPLNEIKVLDLTILCRGPHRR